MKQSRVARLFGPKDLRVVNEDTPEPQGRECLVQLTRIGVCGSDLHYYLEGGIGTDRPTCPHALGHEPAGRIICESPAYPDLKAGMRVYVEPGESCGACEFCLRGDINLCPNVRFLGSCPIEGAFRDFMPHPGHLLIPLPDDLSDDAGAMLEPLAIAVHCMDLAHPRLGDRAAILGCGGVGLCVLQVLQAAGIYEILVYDPVLSRMERAVELGGTPLADLDSDQGVQLVFEATDRSSGPRMAVQIARPGATLILIGITDGNDYSFDAHVARRKGLTLKILRRSRNTTERALELVQAGLVQPEDIVSHHYDLDDIAQGFQDASSRIPGLTKAMIRVS